MNSEFFWGTFVVLPDGAGQKISCSIVEWSEKTNIRLRETSLLKWDQEWQAWYETLEMYVNYVAGRVNELQQWPWPVHITCWVAETVDYISVIEKQFPKAEWLIPSSWYMMWLLHMYQNPLNRDFILDQAGRQDDRFSSVFERDMIATIIYDLFQSALWDSIYVDKRSFSAWVKEREDSWRSDDELLERFDRWMGIQETELLRKTLPKLIWTGGIIPPRVIRAVQLLWERFWEALVKRFITHEGWEKIIQRFISSFHDEDVMNLIVADPFLKQTFAKELIKSARIDHNICLKWKQERKSPPFADVVATFLADKMDQRDGTSPRAVSINYD